MNKPTIYLDFDGVINQITGLRIPRTPTGDEYPIDRVGIATIPDWGRVRVRWNSVLAARLYGLTNHCDVSWLSTWQPVTGELYRLLDWSPDRVKTVEWYDPDSRRGIWTGKLDRILDTIRAGNETGDLRPIVWADDEECDWDAERRIRELEPRMRVLMVRPDSRIGLNQRQIELMERFIDDPSSFTCPVTRDVEPSAAQLDPDVHLGF